MRERLEGLTRREWLAIGSSALVGACTASTGAPAAGANVTQSSANDQLPELPRLLSLAFVPGASVAVLAGDRITTQVAGVTRAQEGGPVTEETVFEAASLSKPVFAYLVHTLAREGTLDLDRPLREYLPLPNASDTVAQAITARHLLSHTSGWRNWRFAREHTLTADFTPGARWSYSGEGYYFLQRVVERVTGRGILRLTRERIFEPLGMTRSAFMWEPSLDANRAHPHSNRAVPMESFNARLSRGFRAAAERAGRTMDTWTHEDAERALPGIDANMLLLPNFLLPNVAGSLLTTPTDYAKFLRHLLATPAVLDAMLTPQVVLTDAVKWGLGVGLQTEEGGRAATPPLFWHWGDNPGFKDFMLADPATRSAVVVFTNGNNGRAIYERVVRATRGRDQAAFLVI